MIDPRSDLISSFTNSRIGAASKYSTSSVYIKLLTREGQEEKEPSDYGSSYVGLMWFFPPRAYMTQITGVNNVQELVETVVDCHLYIPKNEHWFNPSNYGTYIKNILDTFQSTLRDIDINDYGWDVRINSIPDSLTGFDNPNVYGRVVELIFKNIE